ncbi:serine/threonine-protein kinase [Nocardia carnea]|uniref:serine/threonine-protein kinase n=1 Tax=Nocardia carnea TaxID=37328 RepID=UPI0024567256|nr:serine/threonine-protein kinase [Nocardia carnea]
MWYPLLVEGTPFGRYRLLDLLGAGAMGEVHRAYDTGTDRLVAVKVLAPEFAHDAVYRKRFQREAQVAARLAEPHIVPIHDFGEIDGRLFLDMRLVQAPNLAELLAERDRLEAGEAVEVVAQIAAALDAAHAEGLVHRDVKPSNILVTPKGFAYLIDFGIARSDEDTTVTTTGAVIGTFAYMAPERLADDESGTASDVYSLACVLYECLVGAKPYRGESMQRQIAAHLNDEPPLPSTDGLPQAFDAVIAKGMAKDPADRYETAGELAAAARAALWEPRTEPSPVPAAAPPVPDPETQDSMAPSRPIPQPATPSTAPDPTPIAAENPAPATTPDPAPYAVSGLAPDTPPNPAPTPRPPWRAIVVMSVLALAIAGTSALALTQDNSTLVTETPATAPPAVSSTVREPVPSAPRSIPPEPPPAPAPAPAPPVSVTESVPITSAAPGGPVVEPAPPPVWTEPEPQPSEPPPPPPVTTTSPPPVTTTSSEPTESETTTPETTTPETTTPETTVTTTEEGGEEVAGETGADATGSTIATSSAVGPTDGIATPPTTETAASPSTTETTNGTATTSSTEGTAAGPSSTSYTSGNTATPPPNAVG